MYFAFLSLGGLIRIYNNEKKMPVRERKISFCDMPCKRHDDLKEKGIIDFLQGADAAAAASLYTPSKYYMESAT